MVSLNYLLVFVLLIFVYYGNSQSCYIQLENATGFELNTSQLSELETVSCDLKNEFPSQFSSDFKVYEFGFYLQQKKFLGGLPDVFQDMVSRANQQSSYYLLFGRQLSQNGEVIKYWIDIKLPQEGDFSCLSNTRVMLIQLLLQNELDAQLATSQVVDYYTKVVSTIEQLSTYIAEVKAGNCCFDNSSQIEDLLISSEFYRIGIPYSEIPFEGANTLLEDFEPSTRTPNSVDVLDYALLENEGVIQLQSELLDFQSKGFSVRGYITTDENICNGDFDIAMQEFSQSDMEIDIWWHFKWNENLQEYFLYKRIKQYSVYILEKYPPKEDIFDFSNEPCKTTKRVGSAGNVSFQGTLEHWCIELDYVTLINQAAFAEYSIPFAGASGLKPGYVDIADPITGELFEIKSTGSGQLDLGRSDVNNYVHKANQYCPNTPALGMGWKKGINYPHTIISPRTILHPLPGKLIQAYLHEPGVILYTTLSGEPSPTTVPVALPSSTIYRIKDFIEKTLQNIEEVNIDDAVRGFLEENPDIATQIKAALLTTAIVVVVATIIEDIITFGAGISDDGLSFYVAYRLVIIAL